MNPRLLLSNPILVAARRGRRGPALKPLLMILLSCWSMCALIWLAAQSTLPPDQLISLVKQVVFLLITCLPLVVAALVVLWARHEFSRQSMTLVKNSTLSQQQICIGYVLVWLYRSRALLTVMLAAAPLLLIPTKSQPFPMGLWELPALLVWSFGWLLLVAVIITSAALRWGQWGLAAVYIVLGMLVATLIFRLFTAGQVLVEIQHYDYSLRALTAPRGLSASWAMMAFTIAALALALVLLRSQRNVYRVAQSTGRVGAALLLLCVAGVIVTDTITTRQATAERERLRRRFAYYSDIADLYPTLRQTGWLYDGTLKGASLELNLFEADLRRADLRHANLWGIDLDDSDLRFADLRGARLGNAELDGVDLSYADLRYARMPRTSMQGARLTFVRVRGANMRDIDMSAATIVGTDFSETHLFGTSFAQAALTRVDFRGANLYNTSLAGAQMQAVRFDENTILPDRVVWSPDMDMAQYLDVTHPDYWSGYVAGDGMPNATLVALNMRNASLESANFFGADMSETLLEGADFEGSNLRQVNFSRADLRGAELSYAILDGADFTATDLTGANLTAARVTCEQLQSAASLASATLPDGTRLSGTNQWASEFSTFCEVGR